MRPGKGFASLRHVDPRALGEGEHTMTVSFIFLAFWRVATATRRRSRRFGVARQRAKKGLWFLDRPFVSLSWFALVFLLVRGASGSARAAFPFLICRHQRSSARRRTSGGLAVGRGRERKGKVMRDALVSLGMFDKQGVAGSLMGVCFYVFPRG